MDVYEKISEFLKDQKSVKNANLSEVKITTGQNKDGNSLFYVRATVFEKNLESAYYNNCTYYAFDLNGNYVGQVKISVLNKIPPTQVEMEYWANEHFKNKGNITILAKEAIKEIFEEKVFDNLKVRQGIPTSRIDSIMVSINQDNLPSLAVAKKLGFDSNGFLHIDSYYQQLENNSYTRMH